MLPPTIFMALAASVSMTQLVSAHPGELYDKRAHLEEMTRHHVVAEVNSRALQACSDQPEVKARREQAIARRTATFERLRQERSLADAPFLHRRTFAEFRKWSEVDHNKTGLVSYNASTPASEIFGANASCILAPDNANGPYFVSQELIRQNVSEGIPGVPMHLELQFIDINTCKPADVLIDTWSCNATGKYSGVSASSQGGLHSTFLRGVQKTDAEGVVRFDTNFPGHYEFRATHQHIVAHVGSEVLPNGTYTGGRVAHLSQLFFDQDLRDVIEALPPYASNQIRVTTNTADMFGGYASSSAYDPFLNYVLLGSDVSSGLFAWHELGINMSSNWDTYATYASVWAEGGGRDNPAFNFSIVGTPPPSSGGM
ncbi:hypothetical protein diail_9109 [Diaporthe ilicicola]|nr:hypothetical protein diail_9109 [Diaporthe ilicicola]